MYRSSFLFALLALPALAEMPPSIPAGPVEYGSVSYDAPAADELGGYTMGGYTPALPVMGDSAPAATPAAPMPAPSSEHCAALNLNAYTSNYQVRGMGLTDAFSHHGYSSLSGSYTFPNRNLFGRGIQQRVGGELGAIWDARDLLGDTPLLRVDYAVGKEIFPNAVFEVGYSLHHGGLEGAFARAKGGCPHRLAEDVNLTLRYDDHQGGFFGHAQWGMGFQGLTGSFFDAELGYRFPSVLNAGNIGSDVEISAGVAPSLGYWGGGVEGVDAYRVKVALPLFTHNGTLGHDAHPYLRPWVSAAWSGSNAAKIDRVYGRGPIAHSQLTVGVDCGWKF